MKGKTAFNAMEGIDPRYILEAAPDAPVRKGNQTPYIRILAVAATVALLTAAVFFGAGIMKQSGDNPPVVPPVGETQDAQTPTEGEGDESTNPPVNEETELPPILNGSYTTDLYTVTEIDGKHYISFADGNEKPQGGSSGNASVIKGIYFNSIEEMRQKFLQGDFTASEVKHLKSELKLTDKGFEIPDMTNLYDAVLPEGWSVYRVGLCDDHVEVAYRNNATYDEANGDDKGEKCNLMFVSEQRYNVEYQSYFVSQIEAAKEGLLEDQTSFYGIPCKVYELRTAISKLRYVVMEIEKDGYEYEVLVTYILEHDNMSNLVNAKVPYNMIVFGNRDGVWYEMLFSGFESAPDGEFYQMIEIQPFH